MHVICVCLCLLYTYHNVCMLYICVLNTDTLCMSFILWKKKYKGDDKYYYEDDDG